MLFAETSGFRLAMQPRSPASCKRLRTVLAHIDDSKIGRISARVSVDVINGERLLARIIARSTWTVVFRGCVERTVFCFDAVSRYVFKALNTIVLLTPICSAILAIVVFSLQYIRTITARISGVQCLLRPFFDLYSLYASFIITRCAIEGLTILQILDRICQRQRTKICSYLSFQLIHARTHN